jgi:Fe-S-cluster containining protein
VQLSEAAGLADVFVFRLMFRVYEVPRTLAGHLESGPAGAPAGAFHESKRLLRTFAVRRHHLKRRRGGKAAKRTRYLLVSALAVDSGAGACAELGAGGCGIYGRRPLACRTLPFHYSRPEASAERDLEAFVARPGHGCDTGAAAPVVLAEGRIVDPEAVRMREAALRMRDEDSLWHEAILARLKTGFGASLPSLGEIDANAALGATTTSMRVAWQIAAEAGLIAADECRALVAAQAELVDRALAGGGGSPDSTETLAQMRVEYRNWLNG